MSAKVCPQCGNEYELDQRFCPLDGSALKTLGATDLVGETIADRYHVLRKLGEGGMGQVYLAEHVKMGRKSAVKVMNPSMVQDADAIQRFNREAANASRITHPNVAAIYDFGETKDGLIYLAMEFIEGDPLTKLIERGGALPAARAANLAAQTAGGLAVAHDMGIVHRDLKPDNIMVTRARDGSDVVKVVDFGIAKATESDQQKVTKTGLVVGTPEYMSPEQLSGDKLDGRSDIYSLGLVTFNMLTGKLPFPSETVQESMIMRLTDRPRTLTEVTGQSYWPPALQAVLDRALARESGERYASASDFGRDLLRAVEGMPQTVTADAGTVVMGAAGAAGAPTAAIPSTRIAGAAGAGGGAAPRTRAIDAAARPAAGPPEPARAGSRTPMVVGGGVLVAAAAAFIVFSQMGKGDAAVTPATDTARAAVEDSSRLAATDVGLSRRAGADSARQTVTATPRTSSPGERRSGPSGGSAAPFDPDAAFARWDPASRDTVNVANARKVISDVDRALPRLTTARDSAVARYFQAQAWATQAISLLDSDEQQRVYANTCRIIRGIRTAIAETEYRRAAEALLEPCP